MLNSTQSMQKRCEVCNRLFETDDSEITWCEWCVQDSYELDLLASQEIQSSITR